MLSYTYSFILIEMVVRSFNTTSEVPKIEQRYASEFRSMRH